MSSKSEVNTQPKSFIDNPNYQKPLTYEMYAPPPYAAVAMTTAYVGQPGVQAINDAAIHVPDYRALAIISMCFNLLFGIISTYFAFNALTLKSQGHSLLAVSQAKTSRNFAIVAFLLGIFSIVVFAIIFPKMFNDIYSLANDETRF